MAVTYKSEFGNGKFNDNSQCKMWETEIIMHLQTLQQMKKNGIDEKTIAQVQGAIDENLMKIKKINPNYELPHTIDNVEEEPVVSTEPVVFTEN